MKIQQEDIREEETVDPGESRPKLELTLATWEKPMETTGIFVHDTFLPDTGLRYEWICKKGA